jgi:hypothetical protein
VHPLSWTSLMNISLWLILRRSKPSLSVHERMSCTIRVVAGRLAPTCVYDDGCHLVKYIKRNKGKKLNATPAIELLDSIPISVDRSHFRNHVGSFCRRTMNPDKNPCECGKFKVNRCLALSFTLVLKGVNTQAAERRSSAAWGGCEHLYLS